LRKTGLAQDTAMERLSTGIRINNAKDDAAGLAISTRMTANIRGIAAAIRNANDGISLTQTAEGSLSVIGDNLQRIRELAVQSANASNTTSDRAALNAEATQLVAEIDRVANNTTFNGIKLLDGTYKDQTLQVGAGNDANDRLSLSISSAKTNSLGIGQSAGFAITRAQGTAVTAKALTAGDLSINGVQVGPTVSDGVSSINSAGSGIAKAAAINAVSAQTGVTASVSATAVTGVLATDFTAIVDGSVKINGVSIGAIEASSNAVDRGNQVTAAINAKSGQTGVTASSTSTGIVSLSAVDGRNINVVTGLNGALGTGLQKTVAASAENTLTAGFSRSLVTFNAAPMAAGDTISVNGRTFTSAGVTTTAEVMAAFKTGASTLGTFTGTVTNTDWEIAEGATTGATNGTLTLISKTTGTGKTDPAVAATKVGGAGALAPAAAALSSTTSGVNVNFTAGLTSGGNVTLNGLTFTASRDLTGDELAAAFSNINGLGTAATNTAIAAANTTAAAYGAYTGSFATGFITAASSGSTITMRSTAETALANATGAANTVTSSAGASIKNYTSAITLSTNTDKGITLGGATGLTSTGQAAGYTASVAAPVGVSSIDISSTAGAQSALTTLDSAIITVTNSRAAMGAYQNRLTASISNLETTSMNLQASRSRILDTDYAKETTNLAKTQIITQAATAMLAQANQSAQSVLALLK
jgi:flagellin